MDTAIILAGGLGTRLRSTVPNLPKPMAPVNGRPFLSYLMDYWLGQGVRRFILSVGYKSHAICDHYGEVIYSNEEEPLGTGGGVLLAKRFLKNENDFLVLNGDTFFAVDLQSLRENHERNRACLTMSLLDIADNDRYGGVKMDTEGRVISFTTCRSGSDKRRVNGGVYLMCSDIFELDSGYTSIPKRSSLEDDFLPRLLEQGKYIAGHLALGTFIDIGVPDDYRRSKTLLKEFFRSS